MSLSAIGLCKVVNHLLSSAPWARDRLQAYAGSVLRLKFDSIIFNLEIDADGFFSPHQGEENMARQTDVTISLPLSHLPTAMFSGTDKLMNAVTLQGNAELADTIGFVFRNLEWDVEEDLSRLIGDIPAHRVLQIAKSLKRDQTHAITALGGNLSEYFAEEQNVLVSKKLSDAFDSDLRQLRDDLARTEKRIDRLINRTRGVLVSRQV